MKSLIFLVLISLTLGFIGAYNHLSPAALVATVFQPATFPAGYEIGSWYWRELSKLSEAQIVADLDWAKAEGLNTLYFQLDETTIVTGSYFAKIGYQKKLKSFIHSAHARGLKVHGLAGNNLWALKSDWATPLTITDFILSYNRQAAPGDKLDGLQFDIEPHTLPEFKDPVTRQTTLSQYQALVEQLKRRVLLADLNFGLVVPFWFDQAENNSVTFRLMDTLNDLAHPYLVILAYRNSVLGQNGTAALVKDELDYVKKNTPKVKLIIGQEVSEVSPPLLSFFSHDRNKLKQSMVLLGDIYKDNHNLIGFAIHDFDNYKKLGE